MYSIACDKRVSEIQPPSGTYNLIKTGYRMQIEY